MRRLNWIGLSLGLGLLLLAGLSLWPQITSSAHASALRPRSTPTPTATPSPTPTPSPTATPSPTPTPTPVTGSWQAVPSPNINASSTFGNRLNGVAVVSASDIWAVGFGPLPGGQLFVKQTLIEHWDGARWSIVASPNPPANFTNVELDGVFALSADNVWAVGFAEDQSGAGFRITLIEHWDGARWSIVPSPNPDPGLNEFHSIAGVASNDLWAVGGRGDGNTNSPFGALIEHWDGTNWSVVANPGQNNLLGVTALAANNVWAVAFNSNPTLSDIIEHWDGTKWTNVSSPTLNANGGRISLRAITAVSATNIWAVGDQQNVLNNRTLSATEHWDGTAWTVTGLNIQDVSLEGVAASGPSDVWAVDGMGLMRTHHFDGAAWSIISTPNPGTGSGLQGVAAVAPGNIWAAGWTNTNGVLTTLIEHFTQA